MARLLRLPPGGLQESHAGVRGSHSHQQHAGPGLDKPGSLLLLPWHVQTIGEDGGEGREVQTQDKVDVSFVS